MKISRGYASRGIGCVGVGRAAAAEQRADRVDRRAEQAALGGLRVGHQLERREVRGDAGRAREDVVGGEHVRRAERGGEVELLERDLAGLARLAAAGAGRPRRDLDRPRHLQRVELEDDDVRERAEEVAPVLDQRALEQQAHGRALRMPSATARATAVTGGLAGAGPGRSGELGLERRPQPAAQLGGERPRGARRAAAHAHLHPLDVDALGHDVRSWTSSAYSPNRSRLTARSALSSSRRTAISTASIDSRGAPPPAALCRQALKIAERMWPPVSGNRSARKSRSSAEPSTPSGIATAQMPRRSATSGSGKSMT